MAQKGLDGDLRPGPVLSQLVLKVVHRLVDIVAVAGAALAAGARHLDTTLSTGSAAEGVLVRVHIPPLYFQPLYAQPLYSDVYKATTSLIYKVTTQQSHNRAEVYTTATSKFYKVSTDHL